MALKAAVEKLDEIPEPLREHYAEKDGKFILIVQPAAGFELGEIEALKSALGAERGVSEKMRRELERLGSNWDKDRKVWVHSIDPDKAREAIAKLDELGNLDPAKEADKIANTKFEAAKAQLLEKHTGEIKTREERIGHLTKTVESLLIDQAATAALAEAKGSVDLLLPHVRAHTRVKEADGRFSVEVVDKDGNSRIADAQGTPMDIKALIAEMRQSDTFARAFDGDGQNGGGKQPDHDGKGGGPKGDFGGDRAARTAAIAKRFNLPPR